MSSPFSKKFMDKKSSLFMTQKQEKAFGPEGTNSNPEIYEAIKKNDSKTSSTPLEYSTTVATGYVSTRDSLQRMFDDIAEGTSKTLEAVSDPQSQANRLETRIANRNKRADKLNKKANEGLGGKIDPTTGEMTFDIKPQTSRQIEKAKRAGEKAKRITEKNKTILTPRYDKAKEKADSEMTRKLKQYEDLYDIKNPKGTTYDKKMSQIISDYDKRSGSGSFSALDKEQQEKIIAQRLPYTD